VGFKETLAIGKAGESKIAKWMQSRGNYVLPTYEKEINEFKGPVLYRPDGSQVICPDLLAITKNGMAWIEAKHKSAFSWHRKSSCWVTGIDRHHFHEYLSIAKEIPSIKVYLLFLHQDGFLAKDTPIGMQSPTGLFSGEILRLAGCPNHEHLNWGKSGMVYWAHDSLVKLADIEEFEERSAIMEFDGGMSTDESILSAKLAYAGMPIS
jgi:hypothetical protein